MAARPLDSSTWAKIQRAAKNDNLDAVKQLLEPGVDLNLSMGLKGMPLCCAIEAGATKVVQCLLQLSCDVNKKTEDGESPLSLAIRKKKLPIANLLIEADGIGVDGAGDDQPLHGAVRCNWAAVVEKLLLAGAKVNAQNSDLDTALHLSVSLGHRKITDILLDHGADPLVYNKNGEASVHVAAMMGDLKALTTTVDSAKNKRQADHTGSEDASSSCSTAEDEGSSVTLKYLNQRQRLTGYTLLHIAVANNCVEVVKYLITAGCDINARSNDGETPLSLACCESNYYLVKLLVEAKCNVNMPAFDRMHLRFRTLSSKTYPLLIAVCKGSLPIFKCLIEAGADINCVNERENSSLSIAFRLLYTDIVDYIFEVAVGKGLDLKKIIMKNHGRNPLLDVVNLDYDASDVAEKLIQLGCPLDCSGRNNHMTPLHAAVEQECLELMRTLLNQGANMKLFDRDGHMPVHLCAIYGLGDALQVLLEHGADVNWRAEDGDSCLVLAIANENTEIVKLLVNAGHRLPVYPFLEVDEIHEDLEVSEICNVDHGDFELFSNLDEDEPELFQLMKSKCRIPQPLAWHSVNTVRNYFVDHGIPLSKTELLDLPSVLKNIIQMKELQD